jgi:phosphoribosylanthranilate isomerase
VTRVRVKICGLTRAEDAARAIALGADAVGFVLWPASPRALAAADAAVIARALPPLVVRVGVFVDTPPEDVAAIVRDVGLDAVQLHGDEDAASYAGVPARVIKAVAVDDASDLDRARALPDFVTPLVDVRDPARRGGTGRTANWTAAAALARSRPIILAGGLTAENVADAVRTVAPWAIDVSSGVEQAPGIKSESRLAAFFDALTQEGHRR